MKRDKWITDVRNSLISYYRDCDKPEVVESAQMSDKERDILQERIGKMVDWIDKKLKKKQRGTTGNT